MLSKDNPANVMNEDFQDPNFNAFNEGPAPIECQENKRIVLKNVPDGLKKHGIEALMRRFGNCDVHVPAQQEGYKHYKEGFKIAFVEFSKFT